LASPLRPGAARADAARPDAARPKRPNGSNGPSPQPRAAEGFEFNITALRPASGHDRAELIRDVIDAFARLRDSLCRLNRLFAPDADCPAAGASLLPLLATLAPQGESAGCPRPRELKRAIRDARQLDRTRDALFSDAFCRDTQAMRQTLAELERLDALFVGLGVEHVLARRACAAQRSTGTEVTHARTAARSAALTTVSPRPHAGRHAA
jgi:hypothetical protein